MAIIITSSVKKWDEINFSRVFPSPWRCEQMSNRNPSLLLDFFFQSCVWYGLSYFRWLRSGKGEVEIHLSALCPAHHRRRSVRMVSHDHLVLLAQGPTVGRAHPTLLPSPPGPSRRSLPVKVSATSRPRN